jgi:imidazolonepropionase-like amidohydrolase
VTLLRPAARAALFLLAAAVAIPATLAADPCEPGRSPYKGVFAFVNVNVIPMDREGVLEDMTVIVRDGCIVEMGPASRISVPGGATRIEAVGQFLMPGLAELHAHILPPQATQNLGGEAYNERILFLFVANGVTTVRGMLGHPTHFALRKRVEAGEVLGPRIWTSSPSFNGNSMPNVQVADSAVRAAKEAGYDFLKIHPGVTRVVFDTIAAVASRVGIGFAGHVPSDVGVPRALEVGYLSIDHLDGYLEAVLRDDAPAGAPSGFFGASLVEYVDEAKIADMARRTREAGVWNVPTQTLAASYAAVESGEERAAHHPELRYIPEVTRTQWVNSKNNWNQNAPPPEQLARYIDVRGKLIKALHDAGAGLLLGSDAPQVWNVPGFSAHRELETLVAAGLTPYEALVTGTRNVAAFFDVADEQGTVAAGMRADLILLDANPLTQIRNASDPAGVMVYGRWLPRAEIQERLLSIAAERQ